MIVRDYFDKVLHYVLSGTQKLYSTSKLIISIRTLLAEWQTMISDPLGLLRHRQAIKLIESALFSPHAEKVCLTPG